MKKPIVFVVIIGIIIIPITLNFLCLTVFPAPIVGDGKIWLSFWGSYLGGIITVLSTMYVLWREHSRDYNRKEYEIQKDHLDSLCIDMGKLCASINTDTLSFYFMKMVIIEDAISIMPQLGLIDKSIRTEYNEFCLKYAHNGGIEKDNLLNTYKEYVECISESISSIQNAIVDRRNEVISEQEYNRIVKKRCDNLGSLGDVATTLFHLAENWKKKEWQKTESLRLQYKFNN